MEQDLASEPSYKKSSKVNSWKVLTVVFALLFIISIFTNGLNLGSITGKAVLSQSDAEARAKEFIEVLLSVPGASYKIDSIKEDNGLYSIDVTATDGSLTQSTRSYMTKDGQLFFPDVLEYSNTQIKNKQTQDQEKQPPTIEVNLPTNIILSKEDDPSLGSDDAKLTVTEYTEFQCPDCASFYKDTFRDFKSLYIDKGLVRFVVKDFPTSQHKNSMNAALAAACASEQGKYWEYYSMLYTNQNNLELKDLKRYASDLKLDTSKFNKCLDSQQYKSEIEQDIKEGAGLGIKTAPTLVINGRLLKGYIPFGSLKEVLDEELSHF